MSLETITLRMPGELYQRAKRTAETLEQPLEQVLIETLDTALPPAAELPTEIRSDLAALATFSDDDLWLVTQRGMTAEQEAHLADLLELQNAGTLTLEQLEQLDALRVAYSRALLRKARAFALLAERGYTPLL